MRLGLFGGSFDPVHPGHVSIALDVLEEGLVDLVLMVPAACNPFKLEGPHASDKDRLAMLRLAVQSHQGILVDKLELQRGAVSRTIETLEEIEERYRPLESISLITGADTAESIPSWHRGKELLERCSLIVCTRPGQKQPDLPFPARVLQARALDLSSSDIRVRIQEGRPWGHLLDPRVASHIRENELYGYKSPPWVDCKQVNLASIEAILSPLMSTKRLDHSRGTAEYARLLAPRFGIDPLKAWFTAFVHDAAKEFPDEELLSLARSLQHPIGEAEIKKPGILHALAAAKWLEDSMGIKDMEILNAVRMHTSGGPGMGPLARVVFIADKLEFSRMDVDPSLRAASWTMESGPLFALVARATADWIVKRGKILYPETLAMLEDLNKEFPL